MSRRWLLCGVLVLAAAACGDDDGTPAQDAAIGDAGVAAACVADYRERFEAGNDANDGGIPEDSALRLSSGGAAATICGFVNPDADGDTDFFRFRIDGVMDLRIALGADAGASARIDVWTGNGLKIGGGEWQGGGALFVGRAFPAGEYLLSVTQPGAGGLSGEAIYTVELSTAAAPCARSSTAAAYTESADGVGSRDNDVVSITQTPATFALTANAADLPESTGLALSSGSPTAIAGQSAPLADDGDDYRDRDTFALTTGADELSLRLSWPHPQVPTSVDVDLYVFYADDVTIDITESRATATSTEEDETVTIAVDQSRPLWVWVGAFTSSGLADLPVDYQVDICPSTFAPPVPVPLAP